MAKKELKTKYTHIYFKKSLLDDTGQTWECFNNKSNDLMATVSYYGPWRKYVTGFEEDFIFDESCLKNIASFLQALKG